MRLLRHAQCILVQILLEAACGRFDHEDLLYFFRKLIVNDSDGLTSSRKVYRLQKYCTFPLETAENRPDFPFNIVFLRYFPVLLCVYQAVLYAVPLNE